MINDAFPLSHACQTSKQEETCKEETSRVTTLLDTLWLSKMKADNWNENFSLPQNVMIKL